MRELATVRITTKSSLIETRGKIRALAEDLGLGRIAASRIAAVSSELIRRMMTSGHPAKIRVTVDEKGSSTVLGLHFDLKGELEGRLEAALRAVFDEVEIRGDGEKSIGAFVALPGGLKLHEGFLQAKREELERPSPEELSEELKRSRQSFISIVEKSPNGVLVLDPNRKVLYANPTAKRMLGKEDLVGGRLDVPAGAVEIPILRESGEEGVGELRVVPTNWDGEDAELLIIIDITRRKHLEASLREYISKLEQANRELASFAYVASHDLQEPLRMVASYLGLLEKRCRDALDERAQKYIGYAVDGARRMQALIDGLLAYSRVTTKGRPLEPVDSGEVLKGTLRLFERELKELGAEVHIGEMPVVLADSVQLGQLFQNLISNAIKFRSERPLRIEITAKRVDGTWEFCVADNGIGIDPRYHDRIFGLYQRLHERGKYPGHGVGLAIAKKIVERHGGRVWVESKPGEGARFFFTLRAPEEVKNGGEG